MAAARRLLPSLALAALAGLAPGAPRAGTPARAAEPAAAEPAGRGPEVVRLRFAWPSPLESQVTCRRTRIRTGAQPSVFTARYRQRAAAAHGPAGLDISTRATTWEGDLPWAAPVARQALRASEEVVQRIGPDGAFAGLEGAEAMRPALRNLVDGAGVPEAQAERAVARAEAAVRGEAEELWNLSVGFWIDADLELGQDYVMQSEAELPLLSGARALHAVEFAARRRVPCAAAERAARCVEIVLRSTPEPAALARHAAALRARLADGAGAAPGPAAHGRDEGELQAESTLVLVTDPETLVPRRVAWTRAVRLLPEADGAPALEHVDRVEYDYRYPGKAPAAPPAPRRRRGPAGAPLAPAPIPPPVPVEPDF